MSLALPVSLESDAYALQAIQEYEKGKLVLWSWLSRGYSSMEDVARWYFGGDLSRAEDFMNRSKPGGLAAYAKLDKLPVLKILGEDNPNEEVDTPDNSLLTGEMVHIWYVDMGLDGMYPLPHWCSLPIECTFSLWRSELQSWQKKIQNRAPKPLTPTQQKFYDHWLENCTRKVVLDQQARTHIKNPATCSKERLVKHGILLDTSLQRGFPV